MSTRQDEELHMVKNLIEQCLVHCMSQKEVMDILYQRECIEPSLTQTILQQLIDQNQEFFKNYYFWLAVKHQNFNNLVETQTPALEIDRHRLGTLGLKLQVPPAMHRWPPTDNQQVTIYQ
ncbi:putative angiotensin-converting enzyme 2 [Helianthus anomalus]